MSIKNLHTVYFLGIGGIGMSAIARYFNSLDCKVYGYDKTKTALTLQLESEGIYIHYTEDLNQIPICIKKSDKQTLVIYTPAIPIDNIEYQYLKLKRKLYKRSEILGLISENYFTIAIAGTHGKTTTSSIIAHILNECGVNCIAFLGGISLNFNSNLLLNKDADVIIVEADEYDRSFLTLSPDIALITSIDADHLDVYGDINQMINAYSEFTRNIKQAGNLIAKQRCIDVLNIRSDIKISSYSATELADISAKNVNLKEGNYYVDLNVNSSIIENIKIGLPGLHNLENAIGAFSIANKLEIDQHQVKKALGCYKGVQRRFETHIKTNGLVYIDDYAHHPSELEMCIKSVKELYPGKKITGIFQPHLFSRTRDFANEFAISLSLLDALILLDIYRARELPIEGIDSDFLLKKVTITNKKVVPKKNLLAVIAELDIEVLLTLGAGDIDMIVAPLKEQLEKSIDKINE